jgi:hypothetical protein
VPCLTSWRRVHFTAPMIREHLHCPRFGEPCRQQCIDLLLTTGSAMPACLCCVNVSCARKRLSGSDRQFETPVACLLWIARQTMMMRRPRQIHGVSMAQPSRSSVLPPVQARLLLLSMFVRRMHMQQVEFNEAIIEERNEEIMEINRSVLEVNDIMKDLATMVVEQQKDIGQQGCLPRSLTARC